MTLKIIKQLIKNQDTIRQTIILLLLWSIILSILTTINITYIIITEYNNKQIEYYLNEIQEYELL